ncbi:MAG: hypothetical protein IJ576_04990 [Synergistaceae bacterium]|nr:hypothetical protein [Synergistaceae bacterium]
MTKNEIRAAKILAGLFILLGIFILCAAAYLYLKYRYLNNLYAELKVQELILREANNKNEHEAISADMADLRDFKDLELVQPLEFSADFQAEIHKIVSSNDVTIVSSEIYTSQDQAFIVNLDLDIMGNYANIINILAEWRKLPFAVRIAEFDIKHSGSLTYEAILKLQALLK